MSTEPDAGCRAGRTGSGEIMRIILNHFVSAAQISCEKQSLQQDFQDVVLCHTAGGISMPGSSSGAPSLELGG